MSDHRTKQQIAALIDGSLAEPEAERVRRLIENDREAQTEAERLERLNVLLRSAYDAPSDAPLPAPIASALFGEAGKVAELPRRRLTAWLPAAAAAALVVAVGLALVGGFRDSAELPMLALGPAPADGALHAALERAPSGRTSTRGVRPMLTFRDEAGRPCREFEIDDRPQGTLTLGVACRTDAGRWNVEAALAAKGADANRDGYAPASGPAATALEQALDALGAGTPLAPTEEARLIERGWHEPND